MVGGSSRLTEGSGWIVSAPRAAMGFWINLTTHQVLFAGAGASGDKPEYGVGPSPHILLATS